MELHVDARASEGDSFHFEAKALVEGGVALQFDCAPGADDALPGEIDAGVKSADDLASRAGISGGLGDGTVGGDVAAGDFADGGEDSFSHREKISGDGLIPWCTSGEVVGKPGSGLNPRLAPKQRARTWGTQTFQSRL